MTQIHAATDSHAPSYTNLDDRFTKIEQINTTQTATIQAVSDSIDGAKRTENDTLRSRFEAVESTATTLINGYNSMTESLNNAGGTDAQGHQQTLAARLNAIDGGARPERTLPHVIAELTEAHGTNNKYGSLDGRFNTIETELTNAHSSTALRANGVDKSYSTIDARFEAIENEIVGARAGQTDLDARLDAIDSSTTSGTIANRLGTAETTISSLNTNLNSITGRVSSLETDKVNVSSIVDNLTTTTANVPLSANQGKVLNDKITTLEGTVNDNNTAIDALESNVNGAKVDGGPQTLDARFDAVEGRATTLESNMQTIANELGMIDGTAIKDTNTKIDSLEAHVQTMATELGMVQSGQIVDTNTRVDSLEGRMDAVDGASGTIAGLTTRMSTAEGNITTLTNDLNTENTGLKARMTSAENRLTATEAKANAAATASDLNSLTTRVTTLEGKDTIVVNKPASGSNFTNDVPNIPSPLETADYLIADDEGKYFYWRYFGDTDGWQLISSGGSGSSSGVILTELPPVTEGNDNTDYYIGNNTDGYTHYRFIKAAAGESTGHYIRILPNNLIGDISVDQYGGLVAHTIGDNQTNLLNDFYALNGVTYTPNYDPNDSSVLVSQTLQFTGTDGQQLDPIVIVGGGGSGGSVYTVRIETTTDAVRSIPANSTDPVTIRAKVVMKQGNDLVPGATATGQLQYRVYGASSWSMGDRIEVPAAQEALRYTIQNDTYFTVDVSKYLEVDKTMQFRLAISAHPENEETEVMRYQTYTVSKVNISIASEAFDYGSSLLWLGHKQDSSFLSRWY